MPSDFDTFNMQYPYQIPRVNTQRFKKSTTMKERNHISKSSKESGSYEFVSQMPSCSLEVGHVKLTNVCGHVKDANPVKKNVI